MRSDTWLQASTLHLSVHFPRFVCPSRPLPQTLVRTQHVITLGSRPLCFMFAHCPLFECLCKKTNPVCSGCDKVSVMWQMSYEHWVTLQILNRSMVQPQWAIVIAIAINSSSNVSGYQSGNGSGSGFREHTQKFSLLTPICIWSSSYHYSFRGEGGPPLIFYKKLGGDLPIT